MRCFKAVRRHLAPEGKFLLEAFVPDPCRFADHQTVRALDVEKERVRLEVSQCDPVAQRVTGQHVLISREGIRFHPVRLRYAWPSELDLMAQTAGLSLHQRWGSWSRGEFGKDSRNHISVYAVAHRES